VARGGPFLPRRLTRQAVLFLATLSAKICAFLQSLLGARGYAPWAGAQTWAYTGGEAVTDQPVNHAVLDTLLAFAGLNPPEECRAGILANLALLRQHGDNLRLLDDPATDPAEMIAP